MVHPSTAHKTEYVLYMLYNTPNDFQIGFQLLEIINNVVLSIYQHVSLSHDHGRLNFHQICKMCLQ